MVKPDSDFLEKVDGMEMIYLKRDVENPFLFNQEVHHGLLLHDKLEQLLKLAILFNPHDIPYINIHLTFQND